MLTTESPTRRAETQPREHTSDIVTIHIRRPVGDETVEGTTNGVYWLACAADPASTEPAPLDGKDPNPIGYGPARSAKSGTRTHAVAVYQRPQRRVASRYSLCANGDTPSLRVSWLTDGGQKSYDLSTVNCFRCVTKLRKFGALASEDTPNLGQ